MVQRDHGEPFQRGTAGIVMHAIVKWRLSARQHTQRIGPRIPV